MYVKKFANLLEALELCNMGCSREFSIFWDGDGADYLKVIKSTIKSDLDGSIMDQKEPIVIPDN